MGHPIPILYDVRLTALNLIGSAFSVFSLPVQSVSFRMIGEEAQILTFICKFQHENELYIISNLNGSFKRPHRRVVSKQTFLFVTLPRCLFHRLSLINAPHEKRSDGGRTRTRTHHQPNLSFSTKVTAFLPASLHIACKSRRHRCPFSSAFLPKKRLPSRPTSAPSAHPYFDR